MKPYYQHAGITLYHGDAAKLTPQVNADVLVTDPPYGFGSYDSDTPFNPVLLSNWVAMMPTVALFGYPELLVKWCVIANVVPDEWVTWWHTNAGGARCRLLPRESEHIALFGVLPGAQRLKRPRTLDRWARAQSVRRGLDPETARLGDVWSAPSPGRGFNSHLRNHPNEKPLSVMRNLVELCSDIGDAILDPFCGSGSTLIAAAELGRHAIGIEIEERYCEIAARRLERAFIEGTHDLAQAA